jgi:predicted transcriptional regulator
VVNRSRSSVRRRGGSPSYVSETGPAGRGCGSTRGAAVLGALRALPERQREVLVLRHHLELSDAEIADTLGTSRAAVRSHASRGTAALRLFDQDRGGTATGVDDRLRAILEDAVSEVEPRAGLSSIRSRTSASRRRPWLVGVAAAAIATAATIGAVVGSANPSRSNDAPGGPAGASGGVTVYFLADTGAGPRLLPERHERPTEARAAVEQAVTGAADDPDHRTPWPAGTSVAGVHAGQGVLSVDLSGEVAERPPGMPPAVARLAVQQVVWTARAAVHSRMPVRFLLDGRPTPTLLGVRTDRPVAAAAGRLVLAPVSVTTPPMEAETQ